MHAQAMNSCLCMLHEGLRASWLLHLILGVMLGLWDFFVALHFTVSCMAIPKSLIGRPLFSGCCIERHDCWGGCCCLEPDPVCGITDS
jgi:hypothetical protein